MNSSERGFSAAQDKEFAANDAKIPLYFEMTTPL
jgi:hypothetical protein